MLLKMPRPCERGFEGQFHVLSQRDEILLSRAPVLGSSRDLEYAYINPQAASLIAAVLAAAARRPGERRT